MHLAQVTIALPFEPLTSQRLRDVVDLLEPVDQIADAAAGVV